MLAWQAKVPGCLVKFWPFSREKKLQGDSPGKVGLNWAWLVALIWELGIYNSIRRVGVYTV